MSTVVQIREKSRGGFSYIKDVGSIMRKFVIERVQCSSDIRTNKDTKLS